MQAIRIREQLPWTGRSSFGHSEERFPTRCDSFEQQRGDDVRIWFIIGSFALRCGEFELDPQLDSWAADHRFFVVSSKTSELERKFNELAEKWKSETRMHSSLSRIVMHPGYLDIIGLGPDVIPFILRDLEKETNHWFTALRALAKESPVNAEDAGNISKMREAWLNWGRDHGYLT